MGKLRSDGNVALKLPETWLDRLFQGLFVTNPWFHHPLHIPPSLKPSQQQNTPGAMGQFSSHLRVDPKLLKVAKERAIHATSQALLFNYHVLGGSKRDQSDRSSSTATTQVGGGEGDDSNYSQPEFSVKLELEKTTSKKWEKRLKLLTFQRIWWIQVLVAFHMASSGTWACWIFLVWDPSSTELAMIMGGRGSVLWSSGEIEWFEIFWFENFILGPAPQRGR